MHSSISFSVNPGIFYLFNDGFAAHHLFVMPEAIAGVIPKFFFKMKPRLSRGFPFPNHVYTLLLFYEVFLINGYQFCKKFALRALGVRRRTITGKFLFYEKTFSTRYFC